MRGVSIALPGKEVEADELAVVHNCSFRHTPKKYYYIRPGNLFQPKFMRVFLILQNKRSIVDNNKNNKHIIGFQILLTFIGKMGIIGDFFEI